MKHKVSTGYMSLSSPETTAVDLVKYYRAAGYFSNVATVLKDLSDELNPDSLLNAIKVEGEVSLTQRLGWLLDYIKKPRLTKHLLEWLIKQHPSKVRLQADQATKFDSEVNKKWNVIVNEQIEVDE